MKYIVTINNKNYEVEVEKGEATIVKTTESAQATPVVPPTNIPSTLPTSVSTVNGEPVKAPMPGVIISHKVTVGTKVKKGDVLVILEAMKMENEITAPLEGVVSQIIAVKGSSVSTGDPLVVIQK